MDNQTEFNISFNVNIPIILSANTMNKINTLIQKDLIKMEKEKKKKEKDYNKYLNDYLKNKKQIIITI
jgi:hypothetical protein